MPKVKAIYGDRITVCEQMYAAAEGADALVLVTEWHEYRTPNFQRLLKLMKVQALFDGRNMWVPDDLRGMGFWSAGSGGRSDGVGLGLGARRSTRKSAGPCPSDWPPRARAIAPPVDHR